MLEDNEDIQKNKKLYENEHKTQEDEHDIEGAHTAKEHDDTFNTNQDNTVALGFDNVNEVNSNGDIESNFQEGNSEHMISHSRESIFNCIYCHKSLRNKKTFIEHMKKLHYMILEDIKNTIKKENIIQVSTTRKEGEGKSQGNCLSDRGSQQEVELFKGTDMKNLTVYRIGLNRKRKTYTNQRDSRKEKVQYLCNICGQQYCSRQVLRYHMRKMHRKIEHSQYFCGICQKSFVKGSYLKMHLRMHKGNGRFDCKTCGRSCLNKSSLVNHERSHKSVDDDKTGHKIKHVTTRNDMDHFVEDVLNEKVETTLTEDNLEAFPLKVEELYTCFDCRQTFKSKQQIAYHIRLHFDIKMYKCQICKETLADASGLKVHSRIHLGDSVFTCNKCGESFPFHKFLKEHVVNVHGEIAMTCRFCRKVFTKEALKDHMKMHRREDITCKICRKSFIRLDKLYSHMAVHSDERPYKCDTCSKTFKSYILLRAHKRGNKKQKKYKQCDVCGKSVPSKHLSTHMKSHSDVKTFQCEVCSKFFKLKHQLKSHLLTHEDLRKHECKICGFKFKWAHHLRSHLKAIHEGNQADCI